MTRRVERGRRVKEAIERWVQLIHVLEHAAAIALNVLRVIVLVVAAPFLFVIWAANFVMSACILAFAVLIISLFLGWVSPISVMTFVENQGTGLFQRVAVAAEQWCVSHPSSAVGQLIGAGSEMSAPQD